MRSASPRVSALARVRLMNSALMSRAWTRPVGPTRRANACSATDIGHHMPIADVGRRVVRLGGRALGRCHFAHSSQLLRRNGRRLTMAEVGHFPREA
jgi:hypothetical protein